MEKERIGNYLVRNKRIGPDELELALQIQKEAMTHKFLGEIFIEQNILSREDFDRVLEEYLIEICGKTEACDPLLGKLLVHSKLVTQKDLEKALLLQKDSNNKQKLGEILIDEGILTMNQLETILKNQKIIQDIQQ